MVNMFKCFDTMRICHWHVPCNLAAAMVVPCASLPSHPSGFLLCRPRSGLESFLVDPAVLAAEVNKKFAAAATVAELPGKHQGAEVVLQGSFAVEVANHLETAHGIPKKFLNVKK